MISQEKASRENNISRSFFVIIIAIVALLVVIPLITIMMLTQAYDNQIRSETNQTSVSIRHTVSSFMEGAYNLCYELALNPYTLAVSDDGISPILSNSAQRNEFFELLYITNSDKNSETAEYGWQVARSTGTLGDRSTRWWFLQMTETGRSFVGRSYISMTTGMPCTSIYMPMLNSAGQMEYIFGADISLSYMQEMINAFTNLEKGRFSFIIDGEGTVIAHPDRVYIETLTNYRTLTRTVPVIGSDGEPVRDENGFPVTEEETLEISEGMKAVIADVMSGNHGLEIVDYEDAPYYVSYEPIMLPGSSDSWSVVTLQSRDVAMNIVSELVFNVILVILFILAALIALFMVFIKTLRRTLRNLKSSITKAEEAKAAAAAIFEANPQINIMFNSSFQIIDCNPAALQFMGIETKEEFLGSFSERIDAAIPEIQPNGEASIPLVKRLLGVAKKGFVKFETELHIDNEVRTLDVEFKKIPYEGSFAVVGFIYDISNRRVRERELIRAHELNELQLTKLNLVIEAANLGMWDMEVVRTDPVNPVNIIHWSDKFKKILGFENDDEFPDTISSFHDCLHPEDLKWVPDAIAAHMMDASGKTPYNVEYRVIKKNGECAYIHATGETVRDMKGNPLRVTGTIKDITDTKNILLDSERQRIEAEAANEAKSVFLSTMSHEIRTPMNAIIGMTSIGQIAKSIQKKDDAFEKIETASKHLLGIINDILDFSKIESGKFELSSTAFEFDNLVQRAADIVSIPIEENHQKLRINIDEGIPQTLIGDAQRLSQVITNLLSNAVKFTPKGGEISFDSRLISEGGGVCHLQVSVEDTGIGISEEQKERLFHSFEQADAGTSRKYGGTGLGLPISKRIVELMDGDIWVESELGKGSKFIFTVSLKLGGESREKQDSDVVHDDNFEGCTILLAEDVEINREIVISLLEHTGISIECAEDGNRAVEAFKASADKYDMIFMDLQMPEMDGFEATRRIRALNAANAKNVPIIAMTANVFREDVEKCLEAGMNGHVGKPIDINDVLGQLRKYLKRKK